jgi:hypothetical protein
MKIEQQVCRLELATRLKALGVGQKTTWYWAKESTIGGGFKWSLLLGTLQERIATPRE